jgi:hypothetical protein
MSRIIALATVSVLLLAGALASAQPVSELGDARGEARTLTGTVITVGERGMVVRDSDRELIGFSEGSSTPAAWDETVRPGDRVTVSYETSRNEIQDIHIDLAQAEILPWETWNNRAVPREELTVAQASEDAQPSVSAQPSEPVQSSGGRTVLPQTASRLPLLGLIGLLSCAAAVGVRWLRFHA